MKPSQLLREKGWCQGVGTDAQGQMCIMGCLLKASGHDAIQAVKLANKLRSSLDHLSLVRWNDAPGRTKEEVIAALEAIGE